MNYSLRRARQEDMHQVLELIKELAEFENEPNAVEINVENLIYDGLHDNKFTCFVFEMDNAIVGTALVYFRYSTWKGRVLHLEDLIVNKDYRGKGIGTLLLDEVVAFGKAQGVKRISWEVLDWNEPAIKFYEQKGAKVMRDWNVVHMDAEGIESYLKNIKQ